MRTIEEKIKDCERWRNAQNNLENFYEMMRLIKQYPVKAMERAPPCPPYKPTECLIYCT